ncbi:Fungal transcriptional regulatory protein, N-terminal [Pleurostoma richardsiae]|uniref:Fungal transcriptional regulatory protein, N-terminal n=1 Tax=Pleurostoma richardsiae TaxID=41990 RepID=A0AA38VIM4_9PEZI|nr:Fungal transcriptional regulatory protein, N-terminal [Pleurostoma richardsiae]
MVYCGRPSASCGMCRAKKRRCDKAVPICGQCRRMGQECPGYRDVSSLVFRDETTRVIDRARARRAPRPASDTQSSAPSASGASSTGSYPLAPMSRVGSSELADDDDDQGDDEEAEEEEGGSGDSDDVDETMSDALARTDHGDGGALWGPGQLASTPPTSTLRSSSPSGTVDPAAVLLFSPAAPSESLPGLGARFFLANYVLHESGPSPGFLDYTMDVLQDPRSDSALVEAGVCAAGLAGLANTTGSATVMHKARASYADALQRVNVALASPRTARDDSTVLAVMVLGIFETITCAGEESLAAWTRHVQGAADLVIHRGTAQFDTPLGLHVFQEAVSHVLTLCSRYGQAVPPRIRFLRAEAAQRIPADDPAWTLSGAHIEVMDLYQRVDPERTAPCLPDEWEHLLSHAVEIDRRLEGLFDAKLSLHWRFKTVTDPAASPQLVYRGTYHVYYDTWVAKVWDGMRACRILLNQVIYCLLLREGLAWAPHELAADGGAYAGLLRKAVATTVAMRDGILASVPQMLGFVHHDAATSTSYLDCSAAGPAATAADPPRHVPASGAYFLLWHLFLAGSLPMNPPETRDWVVDRLRAIRAMTGIQKAEYLADSIEKRPIFNAGVLMTGDDLLLPAF